MPDQNVYKLTANPISFRGADIHMQIWAAANRDKRANRRIGGARNFIEFHLVQFSGNVLRCTTLHFVGSSHGLSIFCHFKVYLFVPLWP